jgi:hypothetical protein
VAAAATTASAATKELERPMAAMITSWSTNGRTVPAW